MSHSTFLKGFNHGYLLSANKPELILEYKDILDSTSDYAEGFKWGIAKQRGIELKNSLDKNSGQDNDLSM